MHAILQRVVPAGTKALSVLVMWGNVAHLEAEPEEKVFYRNDFEKVLELDVWSRSDTATTSKEERRFLGEFEWRSAVSATFDGLPEHQFVRLKCDVLMLKTVDGDGDSNGDPDTFSIRVEGGPLLLVTTFSNPGRRDGKNTRDRNQCFPDEYPFVRHGRCVGVHEIVDLGFGDDGLHNDDAVFRLDLIFPHLGPDLTLAFEGTMGEARKNESWGLDNVEISTVSEAALLGAAGLRSRWKDLVGEEPVKAFDALWDLMGGGVEASQGEVHLHADLVESRVKHIRRIWDCHQRAYLVTSSADGRNAIFSSAGSANDGFVPLSSHDFRVPRVDWLPEVGGAEWLQYEFDAPKSFTSAAVFWYDDMRPKLAGPPKSWRVQYRDGGGEWKKVQTQDAYGLKLDTFNEVRFERVTTTALRLALESTKAHAPGVLEFRALPVE